MQVTCDEAYTVQILASQPLWDLVSYKDSYTNNHILNTILIKGLFSFFGMNHSLARVPNIAAFLLYFYFCYHFAKRFINEDWVSLMFMCVMVGNPYLLDFFGLARGYGLAIGFMMASVYYIARYTIDNNRRSLVWALILSVIAVYAQFALLHYYLGLNLVLVVFHILKYFKEKKVSDLLYGFLVQIGGLLLLMLLIYLPITAIIRDNQIAYYGTRGFWQDTISSVLFHSIYAQGYFSDKTLDVFKDLTLVLLVVVGLYVLIAAIKNLFKNLFKNKWNDTTNERYDYQIPILTAAIFVSTASSVILQFHLLGNQYVNDRTALFFYPLLALMIPAVAIWSFQVHKKLGTLVAIAFIIFSLNHVKRSFSFDFYREWWYDVHTYEILDFLKSEYDKTDKTQPIRFNMTWMFNPSFTYHREKENMTWIAPLRYDKKPDTTNVYDFYYCTRDEMPALEKQYQKIKEWDSGQWILMKRKLQ